MPCCAASNTGLKTRQFAYAGVVIDPVTHEARSDEIIAESHGDGIQLIAPVCCATRARYLSVARILERSMGGMILDGDDNVLEVYIGYLRKKLEAGGKPRLDPYSARSGLRFARGMMSIALASYPVI